MKWLRLRLGRYMAVRSDGQRPIWVDRYFIHKVDADRLEAGEEIPASELRLYGYGDLGDDPGGSLQRGEPDALVACDMRIARWW